jgi:hypothetical protein
MGLRRYRLYERDDEIGRDIYEVSLDIYVSF